MKVKQNFYRILLQFALSNSWPQCCKIKIFYVDSDHDQIAEASHRWKTDASINGWSIMNEVDCWGNDVQIIGGFQNVEQCIDFWHWLNYFHFAKDINRHS